MKITIDIDNSEIADLLCSALEGGSNYWYMVEARTVPKHVKMPKYLHEVPFYEGALMISDAMADNPTLKKPVRLDLKRIQWGLNKMAEDEGGRKWLAEIFKEGGDGDSADVFLQFCVFGDIIYG